MGIFKKFGNWAKDAKRRRVRASKKKSLGYSTIGKAKKMGQQKGGSGQASYVTPQTSGGGLPAEGLNYQEKKENQVLNTTQVAGMSIPRPVLYVVGLVIAGFVLMKTVFKKKRRR